MKKIINKLLLVIMCGVLMLSGINISTLVDNDVIEGAVHYKKSWSALDSAVKHDTYASSAWIDEERGTQSTGGYEYNGAWETNWIYTKQMATISCEIDDVTLPQGYYTFTTNCSAIISSCKSYQDVFEIRVQNSETGKNLGYRTVKAGEFSGNGVITDIALEFYVPEKSNVDVFFSVLKSGGKCLRAHKLTIETSTEEKFNNSKTQISSYFGEKENITYNANSLYYFDVLGLINSVKDSQVAYDIAQVIVTIQGLVNRDGNHLFIKYQNADSHYTGYPDDNWLKILTAKGGELYGKQVVTVSKLATLFELFKDQIKGIAVWDEDVPATSNVALTACGIFNLLPVRYSESTNSLYQYLKLTYNLAEKVNLEDKFTGSGLVYGTNCKSTGSKKCDAYVFAIENYLKKGYCNPSIIGNFLDASSWDYTWQEGEQLSIYYDLQQVFMPNKDYFIKNKAFFFDLCYYDNVIPGDDITQPIGTDFKILTQILQIENGFAGSEPIEVGGFVAWYFPKYTDVYNPSNPNWESLPGAVNCEWRASLVYGWYNAYTDADAQGTSGAGIIANASIYSSFDDLGEYTNAGTQEYWYNAATKQQEPINYELQNVNYVCVYMGDFDSSAWVNSFLLDQYLNDPARGQLPLAWAITCGTSIRAKHVINRLYENATYNDYFVGGDNGSFYNDPGSYVSNDRPSGLNGNLETYEERLKADFEKFDIDLMGFLISTTGGDDRIDKLFAKYCPYGVFTNYTRTYAPVPSLIDVNNTPDNYDDDVPTKELRSISNQDYTKQNVADTVDSLLSVPNGPTFSAYRNVATPASYVKYAVDSVSKDKKVIVVDPYTFMKLYKEYIISTLKR